MTAGRLCGRLVVTASPNETVRVAARRMAEQDVGTLVVVKADDSDRPLGIVTDRDIAVRCVAADGDPDIMPIALVMSSPVRMVGEDLPLEDVLSRMAIAGTRRLVVSDGDDRLVGILSLDDLLHLFAVEAASIGRLLEKQNPHVPV